MVVNKNLIKQSSVLLPVLAMFSIGAFESFDSVGLFRKLCLDFKNYIFFKKKTPHYLISEHRTFTEVLLVIKFEFLQDYNVVS